MSAPRTKCQIPSPSLTFPRGKGRWWLEEGGRREGRREESWKEGRETRKEERGGRMEGGKEDGSMLERMIKKFSS